MIGRFLTAVMMVLASETLAWEITFDVKGAVTDTYLMDGTRNSIMADASGTYMSAEAFADGVDAGSTTCATAREMEIDYFFGTETRFGGHILFTLVRANDSFTVVDPTIFYDIIRPNGDVAETYANFETVALAIDRASCLPDGTFDLAVTYKGVLLSGMGEGPQQVRVAGTADAQLILKDMNTY